MRVESLRRYPVESMGGESLDAATLDMRVIRIGEQLNLEANDVVP